MELVDRFFNAVEARRERRPAKATDYLATDWSVASSELSQLLGIEIASLLDESSVIHLDQEVGERLQRLEGKPFTRRHSADVTLARACYAICRTLKPDFVLETGVAYGVTSSYVLAALAANGKGLLHSIDLPPLALHADAYIGAAIPERLRDRWRLHRGSTRRMLPKVLSAVDSVDVFIHDSMHTYASVCRELALVVPKMSKNSALLVDDVELNCAYSDWVQAASPRCSVVVKESGKNSLFGIAAF